MARRKLDIELSFLSRALSSAANHFATEKNEKYSIILIYSNEVKRITLLHKFDAESGFPKFFLSGNRLFVLHG